MAQPMKIRATMQGDSADVKVLISHPMETGQRRNEKGELVPQHFITQVTATLNGKTVMSAQWSQAVSRNPFLGFKVKGAKPGDKIGVRWTDNKGDSSSIETTVAAG
jgi:sulfur-oxidizing protein SoxZ